MNEQTKILFREEQRFRQAWLWAILAVEAVIFPGVVFASLSCTGQDPARGIMAVTVVFLFSVAMMLLLAFGLKLVTEVRPDGLYVRFVPLHRSSRHIPLDHNLLAVRPITYSIVDYGGWGIRWVSGGKAYNVSGNQGVRLDLASGRHLMIGSQRADELAATIESVLSTQRVNQARSQQDGKSLPEDNT